MVKKFNHVYYSHFNKIPACIGQTDGRTEMANQDRCQQNALWAVRPVHTAKLYDIRSICLIVPVSMKSLFINVKDNTLLL